MNIAVRDDLLHRDLVRELAGLPLGTHGCLLYDEPEQLLAVLVPFVRLGLARNERCMALGTAEHLSALETALRADEVDVDAACARGALVFWSERTWLVDGRFDCAAMTACVLDSVEDALARGFTGLRATGDLAWEMGPEPDLSVLLDYERELDAVLRTRPIVGMCQFRRADYSAGMIETILRTHDPVCLDAQVLTANPYHDGGMGGCRAEWMAGKLRQAAERGRRRDAAMREETRDRLARVLENMSEAFLALDPEWRITYASDEALRICGGRLQVGRVLWDVCPEPEDSALGREFRRAVAADVSVRFEHRMVLDGLDKWLDVSAAPSPEGLNVFYRDITERKHAEERQMLLMREVDHRAKNALAVAQSIVMLSRADTMPEFVAAVEGRIAALARVHTLLANGKWTGAELLDLVSAEVAPYATAGRVSLKGAPLSLKAEAAQPLAMVLHELATNAAKYGALSAPSGKVAVSWVQLPEGRLRLDWRESGGPPVCQPEGKGFGSQMIALAVSGQLDGSAEFLWHAEGLHCSVTVGAAHMAMPPRRVPGTAQAGPAGEQGRLVELSRRRVLLVEDDALLAMGMQMALEDMGCQVVGPAGTLEAALGLAATEELDAAVLDVNLRGRDSWTVADVLAARGVPHLFTTGYGDVGDKATARGAKVLVKPFQPAHLAAALRDALGA